MLKLKKALRIITNKYLLTAVVFVVWVTFFDSNDYFTQQGRVAEVENTRKNIDYLRGEITDMKKQSDGIMNDHSVLERFAREQYHLKKDNEDVFVFE